MDEELRPPCPGYTESQHDGFITSYTSILVERNKIVTQQNACAAIRGVISRGIAYLDEATTGVSDAFESIGTIDMQIISDQSQDISKFNEEIEAKRKVLNSEWENLGSKIESLDIERKIDD